MEQSLSRGGFGDEMRGVPGRGALPWSAIAVL